MYAAGLRFSPNESVALRAGWNYSENSISGPMFGPTGPIAGSDVTSSMFEDSFLMTFTLTPGS